MVRSHSSFVGLVRPVGLSDDDGQMNRYLRSDTIEPFSCLFGCLSVHSVRCLCFVFFDTRKAPEGVLSASCRTQCVCLYIFPPCLLILILFFFLLLFVPHIHSPLALPPSHSRQFTDPVHRNTNARPLRPKEQGTRTPSPPSNDIYPSRPACPDFYFFFTSLECDPHHYINHVTRYAHSSSGYTSTDRL